MVSSIHLHLHREAVCIRAWTDANGLVMATLGQGLGELTLRLRPDSAAALAMALARALRVPADGGRGGADGGLPAPQASALRQAGLPVVRQLERLGRRDLSACNAQAGRPAHGK
jgi:hypothetical protein